MGKPGIILIWENLKIVKYKTVQIKWINNIQIIIVKATRTEWATAFKDAQMNAVKSLLIKIIVRSRILDSIIKFRIMIKIIINSIWEYIQMLFIIVLIKTVFVSFLFFKITFIYIRIIWKNKKTKRWEKNIVVSVSKMLERVYRNRKPKNSYANSHRRKAFCMYWMQLEIYY